MGFVRHFIILHACFYAISAGVTVSVVTALSSLSSAIVQRRPSLMSEHSSRRPSKPSSVSSTSGACPLWCLVCVRRHRARSSQLRNVKLTMSCVGISYTSGTCRLGVWFVYAAPPCAFSAVEKFKAHDVECLWFVYVVTSCIYSSCVPVYCAEIMSCTFNFLSLSLRLLTSWRICFELV